MQYMAFNTKLNGHFIMVTLKYLGSVDFSRKDSELILYASTAGNTMNGA